jgi:hypothetical protein
VSGGLAESTLEQGPDRSRQRRQVRDLVALVGVGGDAHPGQARADPARDLVAEHRAEYGDADRPTQAPEERHQGAGRPHLGLGSVVLHGQDEVLHGGAEADAQHRHVDRQDPQRGRGVDAPEQADADDDRDHAADQVALPGTGAGDDPPGRHAGDDQPADHEDRHQSGVGG